jgi:hypothetical protein
VPRIRAPLNWDVRWHHDRFRSARNVSVVWRLIVRVRVSAFDNMSVAATAPSGGLVGDVLRKLALRDWGDDWLLVKLDKPLEYGGRTHDQIFIRSRWEGRHIGGTVPTSVFVLTWAADAAASVDGELTSRDFDHVSWAMAGEDRPLTCVGADREP